MTDHPGHEVELAVKSVQELAPLVREFGDRIGLLDPVREITGGWTDRLAIRREVRRLRALAGAAEDVRRLGVPAGTIRDRYLIEILDGAADEDDDELGALWRNLLTSAAIGVPVAPGFPSVLRQLEPIEARLLDAGVRRQRELPPPHYIDLQSLQGLEDLEWRHLDNLERLALIQFDAQIPGNVALPERPTNVGFTVNPFGLAFVEACTVDARSVAVE